MSMQIHLSIRKLSGFALTFSKPFKPTLLSTPKITFIVPYIKFVNYPQDYIWWKELIIPQPSLFVKTTNCKEIYNTWSGEALLNFKWNTYGMYYHTMIWAGYSCLYIFHTAIAYPIEDD